MGRALQRYEGAAEEGDDVGLGCYGELWSWLELAAGAETIPKWVRENRFDDTPQRSPHRRPKSATLPQYNAQKGLPQSVADGAAMAGTAARRPTGVTLAQYNAERAASASPAPSPSAKTKVRGQFRTHEQQHPSDSDPALCLSYWLGTDWL